MTPDEFLAELPALGPWHLKSSLGMIRRADGDCPVQAVARLFGMKVSEREPGGPQGYAGALGMPSDLTADLVDAADGLDAVFARAAVVPAEVEGLRRLRARLLAACGMA